MKKNFTWDKNNNIDFLAIEKELGFKINEDLKEFYNLNLFNTNKYHIDKKYLSTSFKHNNWFEDSNEIIIEIIGNNDLEAFKSGFISNFNQNVIYGDFSLSNDRRYILGYIIDSRGEIGLYFNNDTGEIDWCDFEWGADEWNDNPRGVVAESIKEFINLLS